VSIPSTAESRLLFPVERELAAYSRLSGVDPAAARLEILEGMSACIAGFSLEDYRNRFAFERHLPVEDVDRQAQRIARVLGESGVPAPLALASLSQPALEMLDRRRAGAYYTDFRLARYVAEQLRADGPSDGMIVDPASGSGILLAACVLRLARGDQGRAAELLRNRVAAVDMSAHALRSTLVTLAALTPDLDAVTQLSHRLVRADSLSANSLFWNEIAPVGFDVVVANPPWEKLKLSRHELLRDAGVERHYGADYAIDHLEAVDVSAERLRLNGYVDGLAPSFLHQGSGESDLYKLFMELAFRIVRPGGQVGLIIPAGFIRSQGSRALRSMVMGAASNLRVTIFENRARFFSIDTRFKFLVVRAKTAAVPDLTLELVHARGTPTAISELGSARLGRASIEYLSPDLTIPEVRNDAEWALFKRMMATGRRLGDPAGPWRMIFAREADMTNDRAHFHRGPQASDLPLVEGRMVHQFRFGAKQYIAGTGRRAEWRPLPPGFSETSPQYWVPETALSESIRARVAKPRLGFCDITGQTNERSMLAALIPANVVCGNKVPTVLLDVPPDEQDRAFALWLAYANSLPFDWLLRRVVTTSVNYFLLTSLAFPAMWLDDPRAAEIADLVMRLTQADNQIGRTADGWTRGAWRAEIDARVAEAWGLDLKDIDLILEDFPLLDKGQPPLVGESRSTVTRDALVTEITNRVSSDRTVQEKIAERVELARAVGAVPYMPSEFARRARFPAERSEGMVGV
jgi:methylase of polypeptide subunit release factors